MQRSNAGGAGIVGVGGHDSGWLCEQIDLVRKLTNKSFGFKDFVWLFIV